MDSTLSFFSDLLLFTAGLIAVFFWLVVIIAISVEIYDTVIGDKKKGSEDAEESDWR